jgi:thiamine biosynthesis protein ThiS
MISASVNGDSRRVSDDSTVSDLLNQLNINNRYCGVERNLDRFPREQYTSAVLADADAIEIVTLFGGE